VVRDTLEFNMDWFRILGNAQVQSRRGGGLSIQIFIPKAGG
jgi:hypothetical protein